MGGSEKNQFWCAWSGSEKSQLCVQSDIPLPLYIMQPCLPLVNGFIDDALRNTVPSVNESLLQLVNVTFRFLCNVR